MASKQAIYEMKQLGVLDAYNKAVSGGIGSGSGCECDPAALAALAERVEALEGAVPPDIDTSTLATKAELGNKVDKADGMGLTHNDLTDDLKAAWDAKADASAVTTLAGRVDTLEQSSGASCTCDPSELATMTTAAQAAASNAANSASTATAAASSAASKATEAASSASDASSSASAATSKASEAATSAASATEKATLAQGWAESDSAPGGEGTKSAKTWATEAAASAQQAADAAASSGGSSASISLDAANSNGLVFANGTLGLNLATTESAGAMGAADKAALAELLRRIAANESALDDLRDATDPNKQDATISLDKSYVRLSEDAPTATVAATTNSDGEIMTSLGNTSGLSTSVSGNIITVAMTAPGAVTTALAVKVRSSDTFKASETKMVAVLLDDVSTTLEDNDWATISAVSRAGLAASYWNVGDTKNITLNGKLSDGLTLNNFACKVKIMGFDHNADVESPGQHTITFGFADEDGTDIAFCDSMYGGEVSNGAYFNFDASAVDFASSSMGSAVLPSFKSSLPVALQSVIKPVTKWQANACGTSADSMMSASLELFLLSEFELRGKNVYGNPHEGDHQLQYDYYKNAGNGLRYKHGSPSTAAFWWLRSPFTEDTDFVCKQTPNGTGDENFASNGRANRVYADLGVAPFFCV